MITTKTEPLVSVVTSTFREVQDGTLGRAIESVRDQTYQNWELWIVEDGPMNSNRIMELIAQYDDPRIKFHSLPENTGPRYPGLVPKQKGVELSTGEYLCFLDADNYYTPTHLENSVNVLSQNPDDDLVYCDSRVQLLHPMAGLRFSFTWRKPEWSEKRKQRMQKSNFIDMSEAVMRRSSYDNSAGLTATLPYVVDWILWRNMIDSGNGRFRRSPHTGLVYNTASLGHHIGYFALMMIENTGILEIDLEKQILKRVDAIEGQVRGKQERY